MYTSTISDQTDRTGTGPLARYDDAGSLASIPSRNEISFPQNRKTYYGRIYESKQYTQIAEDVLKETVKDISQTDLNEIIKTAGLTPEPYLYQIPEPGERFEYVVVENDLSQKVGDKMEYPEVARRLDKNIDIGYYLKTVIGLCAPQKSAEQWVKRYIKELRDGPKKDETIISHLWKEACTYAENLFDINYAGKVVKCSGNVGYYTSFLNALDKLKESIHLKLSSLLKEISKIDYKVVGLEITRYRVLSKLQDDKKDDSSEADIDEIIELYG
ncbi:2250_t:CDS:2 [Ambispora gerdemannii]|uniref:2250_t:CDS:1 n=1 Tax=Ambispora gerdemannii TaxID=144530 RepID=A0A9N8WBH4_9GLOM|nr:2250_t:CDS:2 [Ambispora gerdemannii]